MTGTKQPGRLYLFQVVHRKQLRRTVEEAKQFELALRKHVKELIFQMSQKEVVKSQRFLKWRSFVYSAKGLKINFAGIRERGIQLSAPRQ